MKEVKVGGFSGKHLIGIVIPTLGTRPEYLGNLLQSISECDFSLEVVLVCPNPGNLQLPSQSHLGFPMRIIQDDGKGVAAAINKGFTALDSKYWNWFGDDDQVVARGIKQLQQSLESNPDKSFAWGRCAYIDAGSAHIATNNTGIFSSKVIFFGPNLVPQPSCLFRVDATHEIGGLKTSLSYAFDQDLITRLLLRGSGIYLDEVSSKYRWHSETLTSKNSLSSFLESFLIRFEYAKQKGVFTQILNIMMLPITYILIQTSRAIFKIKVFQSNLSQRKASY
jgi:hypothetical protein